MFALVHTNLEVIIERTVGKRTGLRNFLCHLKKLNLGDLARCVAKYLSSGDFPIPTP